MSKLPRTILLSAITALFAGDIAALEIIHDEFAVEIRDFASLKLRSHRDLIDDVLQDTLLDAFESPGRFRTEWDGSVNHFRRWLLGIARNRSCDVHRIRTRRREVPIPPSHEARGFSEACPTFYALELMEEITAMLSSLAAVDQIGEKILRLRFVDKRDVADVAGELRMSKKTVSNRSGEARKALEKIFAAQDAG